MKAGSDAQLVDDVKRMTAPLLASKRLRQSDISLRLGELAGRKVDQSTVSKWFSEGVKKNLQEHTRLALSHMRDDLTSGVWPGSEGEDNATRAPAGVERGSDLEGEWLANLQEIRKADAPLRQKMMSMDALASVVGRIAWWQGERAAEERARAVRSGDESAAARRVELQLPGSPAAPIHKVGDAINEITERDAK